MNTHICVYVSRNTTIFTRNQSSYTSFIFSLNQLYVFHLLFKPTMSNVDTLVKEKTGEKG